MRARPMPVLPAVASTMVEPGRSRPSHSARRMMPIAARSFTLPPGFKYSNFAKTSAAPAGTTRRSFSMGVPPTKSMILSATRKRVASAAFMGRRSRLSEMLRKRQILSRSSLELTHVDLSAVFLELDRIHHAVDEIDAAAVVGVDVLSLAAAGNASRVETVARVAHHDQDAMFIVARNGAVDLLGDVALAAVDNGVRQSLTQRKLDLEILAVAASQLAGMLHQVIDNG